MQSLFNIKVKEEVKYLGIVVTKDKTFLINETDNDNCKSSLNR